MRNYIVAFLTVLVLCFLSCERPEYKYLHAGTICIFEPGDTLLYNCNVTRDTFLVNFKERSFGEEDKSTFIEQFVLSSYELTDTCRNTTPFNCYGFHLYRNASGVGVTIYFRNIYTRLEDSAVLITYPLGNKMVENVISKEFTESANLKDKDVKKVFYTHKYGILAYELFTGELFELDEKYIQ